MAAGRISVRGSEGIRLGKEKQKKLTTLDGWAMGTGAMIGATVFVASGLMAGVAGPASSLSFVIAAAVTLIIASCYCEISSAFPRSGGAYIYPKETMGKAGESVSFLTGWAFYGGQGLGSAVLALTCAFYVEWTLNLIGVGLPVGTNVFAILTILVFGIANMIDTRLGNAIQLVSTFAVIAALLIFIIWGGANVDRKLLTPFMPKGFGSVLSAATLCWATYGGWSAIPNMSSEFRNPAKDVPRSMILSLVTCGVTFGIIGVVMNGLMPYAQLAKESALLAAAAATFTSKGALIIAMGGIFAAVSTLNGLMMSGSRMIYAMGKEGSLPKMLGKVNPRSGTPVTALGVTMLGMLFLAWTGLVSIILQMVAFVTAFSWVISCLCIFALRKNRPEVVPAFHVPFYPVTPVIAIILSIFMVTRMDGKAILIGTAWIIIGFIVYCLFHKTGLKRFCVIKKEEG